MAIKTNPHFNLDLIKAVSLLAFGECFSHGDFLAAESARCCQLEVDWATTEQHPRERLELFQHHLSHALGVIARFEKASKVQYASGQFDQLLDRAYQRIVEEVEAEYGIEAEMPDGLEMLDAPLTYEIEVERSDGKGTRTRLATFREMTEDQPPEFLPDPAAALPTNFVTRPRHRQVKVKFRESQIIELREKSQSDAAITEAQVARAATQHEQEPAADPEFDAQFEKLLAETQHELGPRRLERPARPPEGLEDAELNVLLAEAQGERGARRLEQEASDFQDEVEVGKGHIRAGAEKRQLQALRSDLKPPDLGDDRVLPDGYLSFHETRYRIALFAAHGRTDGLPTKAQEALLVKWWRDYLRADRLRRQRKIPISSPEARDYFILPEPPGYEAAQQAVRDARHQIAKANGRLRKLASEGSLPGYLFTEFNEVLKLSGFIWDDDEWFGWFESTGMINEIEIGMRDEAGPVMFKAADLEKALGGNPEPAQPQKHSAPLDAPVRPAVTHGAVIDDDTNHDQPIRSVFAGDKDAEYVQHVQGVIEARGGPPTIQDDEIWRKQQGLSRPRLRELRKHHRTPEQKKGGAPLQINNLAK